MTQPNSANSLSRRRWLQTVLAGGSLVAWQVAFGIAPTQAQPPINNDDSETIFNLAATLELLTSTHYLTALRASEEQILALNASQVRQIKAAFIAERDHYDFLSALNAEVLVDQFYFPKNSYNSLRQFAELTEFLETTAVSLYLAATRIFVETCATEFAMTMAQLAGVESEHRVLARQLTAQLPNDRPFAAYQLVNVSDGVPLLQAFLNGADDEFEGPIAAPTTDEVTDLRAESETIGYQMTIAPFANLPIAETSPSSVGATVYARDTNVNIRQIPDVNAAVIGRILPGTSAPIDGQRIGLDGFTWWRLRDGGWVREDTVDESDNAGDVPDV